MSSFRHSSAEYQNFLQRKVQAARAEMVADKGVPNEEVEAEFTRQHEYRIPL